MQMVNDVKLSAANWNALAIGLLCVTGYGWFWEVGQNQCAGKKAKEGLRLALSRETQHPVIAVGFQDLDGEVSVLASLKCSGSLEVSFGEGDGVKVMGAYEVTPFGVRLLGHERLFPNLSATPSSSTSH